MSSAETISSQISSLIQSNNNEKQDLQESLKDECISRARSLAYILENEPGLQKDYNELCKIASLLNIDEVNVFDQDGLIAYSTVKDYVGFSIYSGGQIAYFEPMMNDHSLELCQDLTPNTKEGKLIMYAAVWRDDDDSIVQIGISPEPQGRMPRLQRSKSGRNARLSGVFFLVYTFAKTYVIIRLVKKTRFVYATDYYSKTSNIS